MGSESYRIYFDYYHGTTHWYHESSSRVTCTPKEWDSITTLVQDPYPERNPDLRTSSIDLIRFLEYRHSVPKKLLALHSLEVYNGFNHKKNGD